MRIYPPCVETRPSSAKHLPRLLEMNTESIRTFFLTENDHRGRHLSYQRSRNITHPGTSLIKIEGVDSTAAAKYVVATSRKVVLEGFKILIPTQ